MVSRVVALLLCLFISLCVFENRAFAYRQDDFPEDAPLKSEQGDAEAFMLNKMQVVLESGKVQLKVGDFKKTFSTDNSWQNYFYVTTNYDLKYRAFDGVPIAGDRLSKMLSEGTSSIDGRPLVAGSLKEPNRASFCSQNLFAFFSEERKTLGLLVGSAGASGGSASTLILVDTVTGEHAEVAYQDHEIPVWLKRDGLPPVPILKEGLLVGDGLFLHKGKIVHPLIIKEFLPWLSDSEVSTVTIDLDAAIGSNEYFDDHVVNNSGLILYDKDGEDRFSYCLVGSVDENTKALLVTSAGSGSGIFQDLVFVRLEKGIVYSQNGKPVSHSFLKYMWSYALGDRSDKDVIISDNTVFIDGEKLSLPFSVQNYALTMDADIEKRFGLLQLRDTYAQSDREFVISFLVGALEDSIKDGKIAAKNKDKVLDKLTSIFDSNQQEYIDKFHTCRVSFYSEDDLCLIGRLHNDITSIIYKYAQTEEYKDKYFKVLTGVVNEIIDKYNDKR